MREIYVSFFWAFSHLHVLLETRHFGLIYIYKSFSAVQIASLSNFVSLSTGIIMPEIYYITCRCWTYLNPIHICFSIYKRKASLFRFLGCSTQIIEITVDRHSKDTGGLSGKTENVDGTERRMSINHIMAAFWGHLDEVVRRRKLPGISILCDFCA